ncbi:hypothetical protein NHX12_033020 [Muraenolepis orangiensis]|uniref:Uncharacterized protein n=1 Tax=Muraenolepis orangiensis TaxID=630683 RepID=A0A9Q0E6U2_9TELE|nr:hypothetical protein NHX12_033020 [Muraenolepis orangiensis]
MKEVCAALPESLRAFAEDAVLCEQWIEDGDYSFPSLQVTPAVGDWHEGAGQLLTLRTPPPGHVSGLWEEGHLQSVCKSSESQVSGGGQGVEVGRVPGSRLFLERQLAVPVQAARGEADSGPPVEDCARGDSHQ